MVVHYVAINLNNFRKHVDAIKLKFTLYICFGKGDLIVNIFLNQIWLKIKIITNQQMVVFFFFGGVTFF